MTDEEGYVVLGIDLIHPLDDDLSEFWESQK